jgi:hypothetical protein
MMNTGGLSDSDRRMIEDAQWALKALEVQQQQGNVAAIHAKQVVAVGCDRATAMNEAARAAGCPSDQIVTASALPRVRVSRPLTERERRIADDIDFARDAPSVQSHRGMFVAVFNRRVVAVSDDHTALVNEGSKAAGCRPEELAIVVVDRDPLCDFSPDVGDSRDEGSH